MKDIVINKRKLYITLGVILSAAVITIAPVGVMLLVNKANYDKQWHYYEKFTRITGKDLTIVKGAGNREYLSQWTMPANGSYYLEVDEKTYVDDTGKQKEFSYFCMNQMDPSLPTLNNLAVKFNQENRPWANCGSEPVVIYLTDQIKNLTIIFGEKLVQPPYWFIYSSNLHTKKVVLNIEDRTPTDSNGYTLFSQIDNPKALASPAKINVSLTKTSGSRGHTKQEWMDKLKITDESLFSLNEQ